MSGCFEIHVLILCGSMCHCIQLPRDVFVNSNCIQDPAMELSGLRLGDFPWEVGLFPVRGWVISCERLGDFQWEAG